MEHRTRTKAGLLLALIVTTLSTALVSGCVVGPRGGYNEGYYDRAHHRYWHDHGWVDCGAHDMHCH